jgi:flagellar biosynthesis anti-sigma factor FlgM
MAIQPLSNNGTKVGLSSKSTQHEPVKSTDSKTTEKHQDNINFTAVAKEITKAFESSKTTSPINEDRVREVRNALANGTHVIDAASIAKKMMEIEQDEFNNSR